jgi:hypothetical protein
MKRSVAGAGHTIVSGRTRENSKHYIDHELTTKKKGSI